MGKSKKKNDDWQSEVIEKARKTGLLFGLSLNHYEKHTGDELIAQGYNQRQVEIANKVLACFETIVGANLGRCNPDLWCIRPCADCGAATDSRQINAIPIYGVRLCLPCAQKRDAARKCFKCDSPVEDTEEDWEYDPKKHWANVKKHFVGKDESGKNKYEYTCSWCALYYGHWMGFDSFIGKRSPRNDRKILLAQLGIESDAVGIHSVEMGENYGKEDYCIESFGLDLGVSDDPDSFPYYRMPTEDPKRVIWLVRQRILAHVTNLCSATS